MNLPIQRSLFVFLAFFIFIASAVAQDSSSIRTQTIEYIVNHYPSTVHWFGGKVIPGSHLSEVDHKVKGITFSINNTLVKISYQAQLKSEVRVRGYDTITDQESQNVVVEFDLTDIEKIFGYSSTNLAYGYGKIETQDLSDSKYESVYGLLPVYISFRTVGNQKLIKNSVNGETTMISEVNIPFDFYDIEALNRLKELVGA
jgi:hypothetical protein